MKKNKINKKKGGSAHSGNIVCIDYSKSINLKMFWSSALFTFISLICSLLQNKIFNKILGTGCIKVDQFNEPIIDVYTNIEMRDNTCFQNKPINFLVNIIGIISGFIAGIIQFIIFIQTLMKMY